MFIGKAIPIAIYVCLAAKWSVVTVRQGLFGGYMTGEEVMGVYERQDSDATERITIDAKGSYRQEIRTPGGDYVAEGKIFLNTGCNLVFWDGFYVKRNANPPNWEDKGNTTWTYEGTIEYAGHQLRRRSGDGSTFLNALRAISEPFGINILLLGAVLILVLLLLCPGVILYRVLGVTCKAIIKRRGTSIENKLNDENVRKGDHQR